MNVIISSFRDYFARLFEYDRWANGRALEAMRSLGDRLCAWDPDRGFSVSAGRFPTD